MLAFAKSVTVVRDLQDSPRTEDVVDATLALRGHGLTGLAGALDRAAETLSRSRASRRVVVLLSDCRATDGVDPVPAAAGLAELLVVAPEATPTMPAPRPRPPMPGSRWSAGPATSSRP